MSNESKHTEGPTDAELRAAQDAWGQREEAECYDRETAKQAAARRLRDAAPDLLAACEAAVFGANHVDCVRAMQEVLPQIRAAIAKAGGGE